MMNASELAHMYKDDLLNNVIPFWLNKSLDQEFGGFFNSLDQSGNVYDTDKFVWLQARQVWCFSMLYNKVEKKEEWLATAMHGAKFLLDNGRDNDGNWFFSLNREGKPLVQPYNIFSDCFAAMAFGQLYDATGIEEYALVAKNTFENILKRQANPKGKYSKEYPGTRTSKNFALPMILCNLVLELEHILDSVVVENIIQSAVSTVMDTFYQPSLGLILENVSIDGNFMDTYEGRLINPGHGLEAMWFVMDLGKRAGNTELIEKAKEITLQIIEHSWDTEYDGIFYFMDVKGKPPLSLEWDQKLWWVHIETMISLAKGYLHTGDERCAAWLKKIHDYTWKHFVDKEYGEWYGYLNRRGEVLIPAKGGKWKGCFHIPRGLLQLWKTMELVEEKSKTVLI